MGAGSTFVGQLQCLLTLHSSITYRLPVHGKALRFAKIITAALHNSGMQVTRTLD